MPKFLATEDYDRDAYIDEVKEHLDDCGFEHLRVRRYSDAVIIESGPKKGAIRHARLRRVAKHIWRLEMAGRGGRWEITPFRAQLGALLTLLTDDLAWTLFPRE